MIKQYAIFLYLLLVISACKPHNYSNIIPDHQIEEILGIEIDQMLSSLDDEKFTPSRIDQDIIDWSQIFDFCIDSLHVAENICPVETEDTLRSMQELFDAEDLNFMTLQIFEHSKGRWRLPQRRIKFVSTCKEGCARYSIPLYSQDHTKAILYKEEVYNPMAACGLLKVYILENDHWKEYKSMCIWLR